MFSSVYTLYRYFPLQFLFRITVDLLIMSLGVLVAVRLHKKGVFNKTQMSNCVVLFVWVAIVLLFTVLGRRSYKTDGMMYNMELFSCYSEIFINHNKEMLFYAIENIIMFIPIGFTLSSVFKKHKFIFSLLISFVLSLGIEVCQVMFRSGFFELDDIFNNALGAFIGSISFLICNQIIKIFRNKH